MKASLRWRVLLVLALAAVVPTVVVGTLAILRARHDVQDEVVVPTQLLESAMRAPPDVVGKFEWQ